MIMVESRFRVANGMADDVRNAFLHRPGLVDDVTGFLGMEVYVASDDHCVFHLVTRWTDAAAYTAWHRSDAHHNSHAFIPRGLKLEAAFTRLTTLERLAPKDHTPTVAEALADAAPAVATWLDQGYGMYVLLVGADGQAIALNRALAERLEVPFPAGSPALTTLLANDEATELSDRIARLRGAGTRGITEAFLLNPVNASGSLFTLHCRMDVQPTYAVILAEGADGADDRLRDELLTTNNLLAVLAREREAARQALEGARSELARVNAEQAATLEALHASYWHIQRIQELLPICMDCGEVKSADGGWQPVREFMTANAMTPFLSHGYCPACAARQLAEVAREDAVT
ncbi:MAG: antibiotic biosynthesis monooxygenase [Gemmatimonadetes bacterium]|nr:antibiotic biosynthesis monooxygenase [Gemmatimonadota bacterium]